VLPSLLLRLGQPLLTGLRVLQQSRCHLSRVHLPSLLLVKA
jgi:hypothetical protein